jgi:hypothetical protein
MNPLPCHVTSHDLVKMASVYVNLPNQLRPYATEGYAAASAALSRALGVPVRVRNDDDLLMLYEVLRECTGLHPADLITGVMLHGRTQ